MSPGDRPREPVLDGVRGIAILLVLFHHFVIYSGLSRAVPLDRYVSAIGGATWFGVDLFFVLSGFLITGILFDTKGSPHFFRTFYGRRTVRIFPLYYGMLAIVFVAAPRVLGHPLFESPDRRLWYWTYLSNVDVALHGWPQPLQLGHFWSLAVEEQFYLLWPLVVFMFQRHRLLQITVACFVVALVLRLVVPIWLGPLSAYTLMPMRMDALAAGAFVTLAVRGPQGWGVFRDWPRAVFLLTVVLLALLFVWQRGLGEMNPVVRTVGYSAIAVGSAAFIAIALRSDIASPIRRVLSSRVLVSLGTYSYGLYVFHHIVVLTLRDRGFQAALFPTAWGSHLPGFLVFSTVAMGASSLLAFASWHLWEMPFLRLKRYLVYRRPPPTEHAGESHLRLGAAAMQTSAPRPGGRTGRALQGGGRPPDWECEDG